MRKLRLLFGTNDWRSKPLEEALKQKVSDFARVEYDPVPAIYKYPAAALTYNSEKMVWWNKFQWHPLVQKGRRKRLMKEIKKINFEFDAFLMYSSWYDPFLNTSYHDKPFYFYIDQSCNQKDDAGDPTQSQAQARARLRFNHDQKLSYDRAKGVFCFSNWAVRQTIESHPTVDPEKIMKVGWGPIGVNFLDDPLNTTDGEPNVLLIGNEFHRKGVDFLREAVDQVVKEVPNAQFNVVGGNIDQMQIKDHPNFHILGKITDRKKMETLVKRATILTQPHRFDRSPHALIETMSSGKPVIITNQGGAVEVVEHEKNGYIIEKGDVNALAQHIITLLKDKELCLQFGQRSKEIVREGHTMERIAEKMLLHIEKTY